MTETAVIQLPNAPLKEVIFELHWKLDVDPQQNSLLDIGFEDALLQFKAFAKGAGFAVSEAIHPAAAHSLFANRVTQRFRKAAETYPVYQFGPGIFTVNDNNKNYSWRDYQQLIVSGLDWLRQSYLKTLVPSKIELRYIDAVNWPVFGSKDKFEFLREHLNVNAESWPFVAGQLVDINFSKRFQMSEDAYLAIVLATGQDEAASQDVVIWHTFINNRQNVHWDRLGEWLEKAHTHCSETFKKMISRTLYDYFNK